MSETLWERVLSCLDVNGLVDMTRELVRIRSVFDPETEGANEEKVARFLASRLEEWGFSVVMEEVSPGRPNVIATIAGNEPGKTILFEGHTDVVTEGDPDEWEVDPFGGELKEGLRHERESRRNDIRGKSVEGFPSPFQRARYALYPCR